MLGVSQAFASSFSLTEWRATLVVSMSFALASFLLACKIGDARDDHLLSARDLSMQNASAPSVDVQGSAWALLCQLDFYLLMLTLIISQGSGLMVLNSSAQILPAIKGEPVSSQSFVGFMSVVNCIGRLLFGGASDELASVISRPWWLVAGAAIVGLSHLLLYLDSRRLLWLGATGVAFGFGGVFGVLPALVKELLGSKELSLKLSFTSTSALIGSVLFGTLLTGNLYDKQAEHLGTAPDCFDPSCFQTAFLACASSCAVAACLAAVLAVRTAWIYDPAKAIGTSYGSTSDVTQ